MSSAVERLAQRRAAKEAEDRAKAAEAEEAAAEVEMQNLDTIDALKAKFPGVELKRVDTIKGMAVVRAPKQEDFNRFQKALLADEADAKLLANQVLAEAGTVHPSYEVLEQWKKEGFLTVYGVLAARVIETCGSDTTVKKV